MMTFYHVYNQRFLILEMQSIRNLPCLLLLRLYFGMSHLCIRICVSAMLTLTTQ